MPLTEAAQARSASNAVEKAYLKLKKKCIIFPCIHCAYTNRYRIAWNLKMLGRSLIYFLACC